MKNKIIKIFLIFIIIFNLFVSIQFYRGYDIYGESLPPYGMVGLGSVYLLTVSYSIILNIVFLYNVLKKKYRGIIVCYILLLPLIILMFSIIFCNDFGYFFYRLETKEYADIFNIMLDMIISRFIYLLIFSLEFIVPIIHIKSETKNY